MPRKFTLGPVGAGVLLVLWVIGSIGSAFSPDVPESAAPRPEYSASAEPSPAGTESTTPTPAPTEAPVAQPGTALAVLDTLAVKELGPQSGYDREGQFGDSWIDVDWNGCDTRNDILRRDFEDITRQDDCLVYTGVIEDPYTGEVISFTRGRGTSNAVQIDHIVALSNAWKTGAPTWSQDKRVAFANDPLNLVAVDGPTNGSKGDDSADWWLPPKRSVWCWYVAHQVSVKSEYGLWVTPDEKVAMKQVLTMCPTQQAWTSDYPERVAKGDLNTR
jgi:hypothetical protein